MLVQIQQKKQKIKLSQILKNATEEQCFGYFMKISEITDLDEDNQQQQQNLWSKYVLMVAADVKGWKGDESSSTTLS